MRSPVPLLFLLLAGLAPRPAAAQGAPPGVTMSGILTSVPSCAQACTAKELAVTTCTIRTVDDLADCLCRDMATQSRMSECVQKSCDHGNVIVSGKLLSGFCSLYPRPNRGSDLKIAAIVSIVVILPLVFLRCLCRIQRTGRLWWDDWMCIFATIFAMVCAGNAIATTKLGTGMHFWNIDAANETALWKLFWTAQLFYILTQLCVRVAIFILYLHIFEGRVWFRVACYTSIGVIVTGNLIIFFLLAFQCKPIETIWNKFIVGQCLDVVGVTYATGAFAVAWDVILVVLPIPEVRRLQISVRERVMLLLLFGFAALSSVASIIRLKFVVQFNTTFDPTWDNVDIAVWSLVETMFMIFCSTLPTLRPWLSLLISKITNTNNSSEERTPHDTEITFGQVSSRRPEKRLRPQSAASYLLSPSPSAEGMELPPIAADRQSPEKVHIAFLQVPAKKGFNT